MTDGAPPTSAFTARERRVVARLRTPAAVQAYLNALPYNTEPPPGRATLRSFRGVVAHGTAHCLEAAITAAVVLEQHGYPPLVMSLESIDALDHVVFVYERRGRWGSVARSRDPGLHGRRPVFYGPGLEFLDRYFPGHMERGQPLWFHWGTSYGPAQIAHLSAELATSPLIRYLYVTLAFDTWPPEIRDALGRYYYKDRPGPVVRRWTRRSDHNFDLADSFEALQKLGGNLDSRCLIFDRYPLAPVCAADGRGLLGTTQPFGQVLISAPTRRFRGVAVVDRLPNSGDGLHQVLFKIRQLLYCLKR